jgi:hypothetical protein
MDERLVNFPDEKIEKGLIGLLKETPSSVSKFSVRQIFENVLVENGVKLSKEEEIRIYTGEDEDDFSKKINQVMRNKKYILHVSSYDNF